MQGAFASSFALYSIGREQIKIFLVLGNEPLDDCRFRESIITVCIPLSHLKTSEDAKHHNKEIYCYGKPIFLLNTSLNTTVDHQLLMVVVDPLKGATHHFCWGKKSLALHSTHALFVVCRELFAKVLLDDCQMPSKNAIKTQISMHLKSLYENQKE
jgi:hypothetical protein